MQKHQRAQTQATLTKQQDDATAADQRLESARAASLQMQSLAAMSEQRSQTVRAFATGQRLAWDQRAAKLATR